jgi:hypothetical protein
MKKGDRGLAINDETLISTSEGGGIHCCNFKA